MTKKKENSHRRERRRIKRKKRKSEKRRKGGEHSVKSDEGGEKTKQKGGEDQAEKGEEMKEKGDSTRMTDGNERRRRSLRDQSFFEEALQNIDTSDFGQRKRNIEKRIKSKRHASTI